MAISDRGAIALQSQLAGMGYSCVRRGDSLLLDNLGVHIGFCYVPDRRQKSNGTATYAASTYIPMICRTVQDIVIGIDPTRKDPHAAAASVYAATLFPLVHSLFCGDHAAMHVQEKTLYAVDAETGLPREWSLLLGPLRNWNLPIDGADTRRFVDAIADIYEPMLVEPGVYWFRCFANQMKGAQPSADCYLNNEPHDEGERLFVEVAKSFRGSNPWLASKQHVVIVPRDLAAGLADERGRRRARWAATVANHEPLLDSVLRDKVFLGIESFMAMPGFQDTVMETWCVGQGCTVDEAWRLNAFIQEACARERWGSEGARFCDVYIRLNPDTGKGHSGLLSKEPLFGAAERVIRAMRTDGLIESTLDSILAMSATHNAMMNLIASGRRPSDVSETYSAFYVYEDVDGEIDPAHVSMFREVLGMSFGRKKPWWKFW